jgi:hypothetical protein
MSGIVFVGDAVSQVRHTINSALALIDPGEEL